MYNFKHFADSISSNFTKLGPSKLPARQAPRQVDELYVTDTSKEDIYSTYLAAFPEGTNPIYRSRAECDCSTCKSFIRGVGNVVAIEDGKLVSVWDVEGLKYPYNIVAAAMSQYVKSRPITSIFRTKEGTYGASNSRELLEDGTVRTWAHFYAKVPPKYINSSPGQVIGESVGIIQVMKRGLSELTLEAVDTVLDLIASNSLYRGEEHKLALISFKELKNGYSQAQATCDNPDLFLWSNLYNPAARLRNTVIGTLVADLSEGVDLEKAIKAFESKVAPANYKRPKSLITPAMVKDAVKTIEELGIEASLHRRFARISDVSVNDVLFVDNEVRGQMKDSSSITSLLMAQAKGAAPNLDKTTPISIQDFMATVVPQATGIDVLFENRHLGNLVSITAPTDPEAPPIFKWGNNFAWSYKGNVTDSPIKERVKAAGGNVTAPFRVSLGWFNYDDLDIHVVGPRNSHIYYGNKRGKCGGLLDIDMNAGAGGSRNAVENVCWTKPTSGTYLVKVHNFCKRESIDTGFTLEVESLGEISEFHYPYPVRGYVESLRIEIRDGKVVSINTIGKVEAGNSSKEEWGIKTQSLVRVDSVMLSPNYWIRDHAEGHGVGNKHYFFILHGCLNPEPTRGIYNEYLSSRLDKHRKVFEILGDQTKAQPTADQLSGLGFSSTKGDKVRVLVHDPRCYATRRIFDHPSSRAYEINF